MAAAMIDDLVGWLGFSVLVNPMQGGELKLRGTILTVGLTITFVVACLVLGRYVVDPDCARGGLLMDTHNRLAIGRHRHPAMAR